MNTLVSVLIGTFWIGSLVGGGDSETRVGYVMPTACKSREDGGPKEHTTECALEPDCVASGFGLWIAEDEFLEFDARGDDLALRYFKETKKIDNHRVEVAGDFSGTEVKVKEIKPIDP